MTDALDTYDTAILKTISSEGRITVTDLSERINLSKSPTQTRLRRLEKDGYIRGYTAQLNPVKLGLAHIAFVEVKLDDTREAALRAFNEGLKIRTTDMISYRRVLGENISALPHVAQTSTHVVMEAVKEDAL